MSFLLIFYDYRNKVKTRAMSRNIDAPKFTLIDNTAVCTVRQCGSYA